ncbi:site-specific integrase (plasmid) [Deinococcus sp. KNUC1210]|uniref:site-specific integrase n=1 Tax=Deinococcus sp. KNUC1210 TaxID=2917691 RepID=UPI001EEFA83C|nr:site-specific integrase [Deinococcus sp. KNUC1210]ULH18362.1 site-specific integrase [Deinococcus sp. KNUC1210]
MLSLRRADLHLDVETPYLMVDGKGGKRQSVPVSPTLKAALKSWVAMTPQLLERVMSVRSSCAVEVSLSQLCAEGGVEYQRRHVHGLRHSAGTRVYVETRDLLEVRDHLRHRDITSSEIYVEYARKGKPSVTKDW